MCTLFTRHPDGGAPMEGDPMNREEWLAGLVGDLTRGDSWWQFNSVAALPSFPTTAARGGRVCDLTRDASGLVLALISPHLAESFEVGVTVAYLLDRAKVAGVSRRLSARQVARLSAAGWVVDGWRVNPSDALADRLAGVIDAYVDRADGYPAAAVAPANVTRQGTRMLALTCPAHPEVRVRATRAQIDAGAPLCGRPVAAGAGRDALPCALRLGEVA